MDTSEDKRHFQVSSGSEFKIEKHWDGNVCESEHNGRIYVSNGRWQWLVLVDGQVDSCYDRKSEARWRVEQLQAGAK